MSDPAGLGVARLLLGDNDPEHVAAFVESMIGPVRAWDERRGTGLVDTLEEWFASGGRLKEAAAALHVHPNTVTQRLDRIGDLLGDGWRDPAARSTSSSRCGWSGCGTPDPRSTRGAGDMSGAQMWRPGPCAERHSAPYG